ncbi:MAG: guanylate kinase [Proteobacteria bacterium]|nr:guanylate kinase [Pseudomonadota bacterium]
MTIGKLFVVSAPSGTGKTTLLKRVMAQLPGLSFSVSHTTRPPRPGERSGVDYHFVSKAEFLSMIDQGLFLEHAEVHGNRYGTSRTAVDQQLMAGVDIILDIDVQGASILRRLGQLEATHIFISPPSITELEKRLRGRGTENEEMLAVRLANARVELQAVKDYEYLVINDSLEETVDLLSSIIVAERARAHRFPSGKPIGDRVRS